MARKLDPGVVAGIVIGVAIVVGLMAFAAGFLLKAQQHRQKEKRPKRRLFIEAPLTDQSERRKPEQQVTLDHYLPQPVDDKSINVKATNLQILIDQHVENYYKESSALNSTAMDALLAPFGTEFLPGPPTKLLSDPRSQTATIKHCLAYFILSAISPIHEPGRTLLPQGLVTFMISVVTQKSKKPAFDLAFARWRQLSAYIRPESKDDISYATQRNSTINDAVETISQAFSQWQDSQHDDKMRIRNLRAILNSAADFGLLLLSQAAYFDFDWSLPADMDPSKTIVVFPALLKTMDEDGQSMSKPWTLLERDMWSLVGNRVQ